MAKFGLSLEKLSQYSVSLVIHVVAIVTLASLYIDEKSKPQLATVVTEMNDVVVDEEFQEEIIKETELNLDTPISMSATAVAGGGGGGGSGSGGGGFVGGGGLGVGNPIETAGQTAVARAAIGNQSLLRPLSGKIGTLKLDSNITGLKGSNEIVSTGGDGDKGAIQRVTQEVLRQLSKGKVVVAWIFDASLSLEPRRTGIAEMFDRIYDEFTELKVNDNGELLTSVVAVGQRTEFLLDKPTNDPAAIKEAIRSIKEDESGVENLFRAVRETASKYRRLQLGGQRTLMIVLVTDEVGDDRELANDTVKLLQRNKVPLYVMGPVASFGQEILHERWVDPETQLPFWIPMVRGPYTRKEEMLRVAFNGAHYPSGFGTFALTQISRETGGIYFIFPDDKVAMQDYSTDVLMRYKANYGTEDDYEKEINSSPLRQGLMEVVEEGNRIWHPNMPPWWLHDQNRTAEIDAHQKVAALFSEFATKAITKMETLEKSLPEEGDPRWRANFELLYARLLQAAVRCAEYNWAYADFKLNPRTLKDPKKSNGWHVQFVESIRSGTKPGVRSGSKETAKGEEKKTASKTSETIRGWVEKSMSLYQRVIDEHPGTPWSQAARAEKSNLVGVDLMEGFDGDYIPNESREKAAKVKVPKR